MKAEKNKVEKSCKNWRLEGKKKKSRQKMYQIKVEEEK